MKFDLTGKRFGRLTVVRKTKNRNGLTMWLCKCDCGTEKEVRTTHLRSGASKSCGCHQYDHLKTRERNYPENIRIRRLYYIWRNMLNRCKDKNNIGYKNYGGRGISVCEEWYNYIQFANWALNNGYKDNLTIDRINNNGNYEPSNCKWSTIQEQHNNRRNSRLETINGKTKTVAEWAKEYGLYAKTVYRRLDRGIDIIDALKKERFKKGGYIQRE